MQTNRFLISLINNITEGFVDIINAIFGCHRVVGIYDQMEKKMKWKKVIYLISK